MSLYADLSGIPVTKATLVFPYTGIWHADITLDRIPDLSLVPLVLNFVGMTMRCTAVRAVNFTGVGELRVIGGAGGWRQMLDAKQYDRPFVSTVLLDAALSVGETIAVAQDDMLDAFVRRQARASAVLQELIPDHWWMDNAGITQTLPRPSLPVTSEFAVTDVQGAPGVYTINTEHPGDWTPGSIFASLTASGTVNRVTHRMTEDNLQTEVMVT